MRTRPFHRIVLSLTAFFGLTLACAAHPLDLWYSRFTNSPATTFYSVAYGNGNFVGVGASGAIARSTNGSHWTVTNPTSQLLADVTYASGKFVAIGDNGTILTSSNSINWENHSPGTNIYLKEVAHGNARFVALGYTTSPACSWSLVSTDGVVWTQYFSSSYKPIFGGLAFCHGLFVYPGARGTNLLSADGISWWNQPTGLTNDLYMIGSSADLFVAFDIRNLTFTSDDGTNWTFRATNSLGRPEGLASGDGFWVAVSRGSPAKYSADLVQWTAVTNAQTAAFGTCFGNGSFLTANSVICQSAPIIRLRAIPGLRGAITLSGPAGVSYEIQTLGAFGHTNWQTATNLNVNTSPYLWIDPDTAGFPQKFYRVRLP